MKTGKERKKSGGAIVWHPVTPVYILRELYSCILLQKYGFYVDYKGQSELYIWGTMHKSEPMSYFHSTCPYAY